MSMIETLTAWDEAAKCHEQGQLDQALNKLQGIADPSSKILFNIACVQIALGHLDDSIKSLSATLKKDEHMAVGYFQRGTVFSATKQYKDSLHDFEQCFDCLRGRSVIDYQQLGLRYKLYECDILHNTAIMHAKLNNLPRATELLWKSQGCKVEPKHSAIDQSLQALQEGRPMKLIELPNNALFRPPKSKTANIGKKDYLGKAKVLSSVVQNDEFSGFMGPQKLEEDKRKALVKSAPCSPSADRKNSASLLASPGNYIKRALTPSPPRTRNTPSPAKSDTVQNRSPCETLVERTLALSIPVPNTSDPQLKGDQTDYTKKPVFIPPVPNKSVPKPPVVKLFNTEGIVASDDQKNQQGSIQSRSVFLSNSQQRSNQDSTLHLKKRPPPPTKDLPPPPLPSRNRKPESSSITGKGDYNDRRHNGAPVLPVRSFNPRTASGKGPPPRLPTDDSTNHTTVKSGNDKKEKPSLPLKDLHHFKSKQLDSETSQDINIVSVTLHCNKAKVVKVQYRADLNTLLDKACTVFDLPKNSIDLWCSFTRDEGVRKIEDNDEMQQIWKGSKNSSLELWCYSK